MSSYVTVYWRSEETCEDRIVFITNGDPLSRPGVDGPRRETHRMFNGKYFGSLVLANYLPC